MVTLFQEDLDGGSLVGPKSSTHNVVHQRGMSPVKSGDEAGYLQPGVSAEYVATSICASQRLI